MAKRTEYPNGTVEYYNENGKLHRENGPALIYSDGSKYWWLNGKIHREDGPAIIIQEGTELWFLNGYRYSFNEWIELVNISDEEKMELILRYG